MKFEVINKDGAVVMSTNYVECVPDKKMLNILNKYGYKFKIDGKIATKKRTEEIFWGKDND